MDTLGIWIGLNFLETFLFYYLLFGTVMAERPWKRKINGFSILFWSALQQLFLYGSKDLCLVLMDTCWRFWFWFWEVSLPIERNWFFLQGSHLCMKQQWHYFYISFTTFSHLFMGIRQKTLRDPIFPLPRKWSILRDTKPVINYFLFYHFQNKKLEEKKT